MAECRPKNYPKLKDYKPSWFMLPTCHYDAAKADRAVTFIENLRHTKGKWAGKRFWLLPWQEQIIRDVFGIVDEKGNRQFRTAYVEIGKKNGKSELAAAVALYLLFADNEPSAEVYGAAADRQQASIVFDVGADDSGTFETVQDHGSHQANCELRERRILPSPVCRSWHEARPERVRTCAG